MTTNEVAENMRKVYLDFAPASIEITNYDELKNEVEKFATRYSGMLFGRDEKKDAEEIRGRLIALRDALESERKEVKAVYNKPLKSFEDKIKDLTTLIDKPLNEIRDGLKQIETHEKEERELALKTLLEAKLEPHGLLVDSFPIEAKWLNKGQWTSKMKATAKLESEIDKAIEDELKEIARYETEVKLLTSFCETANIEPAGWITQLEHRNAMEVIDLINLERERKKKLDEELAEKKKVHEEFLEAQKKAAEEAVNFAQSVESPKNIFISEMEVVYSASLKIFGTEKQLSDLNEYIKMSGLQVEEITEEITEKLDEVEDWAMGFDEDDFPF